MVSSEAMNHLDRHVESYGSPGRRVNRQNDLSGQTPRSSFSQQAHPGDARSPRCRAGGLRGRRDADGQSRAAAIPATREQPACTVGLDHPKGPADRYTYLGPKTRPFPIDMERQPGQAQSEPACPPRRVSAAPSNRRTHVSADSTSSSNDSFSKSLTAPVRPAVSLGARGGSGCRCLGALDRFGEVLGSACG